MKQVNNYQFMREKWLCVSFVVSICFFGLYNKLAYFERLKRERERNYLRVNSSSFKFISDSPLHENNGLNENVNSWLLVTVESASSSPISRGALLYAEYVHFIYSILKINKIFL